MTAPVIEQAVDLAELVGEVPPPPCEMVLELATGVQRDCGKPSAWWLVCPCGETNFVCDPCRASTTSQFWDWECTDCGRTPEAWTWRPL